MPAGFDPFGTLQEYWPGQVWVESVCKLAQKDLPNTPTGTCHAGCAHCRNFPVCRMKLVSAEGHQHWGGGLRTHSLYAKP